MRLVRVLDRQRTLPVNRRLLRDLARRLVSESFKKDDFELGVHLIGATEMARLNAAFLGHEGSTDVITFNNEPEAPGVRLAGEIFLSVDDAVENARRFRVPWQQEICRYLVHGLLHLAGMDDSDPVRRRAMKRREGKLLKELSGQHEFAKLRAQWRPNTRIIS